MTIKNETKGGSSIGSIKPKARQKKIVCPIIPTIHMILLSMDVRIDSL